MKNNLVTRCALICSFMIGYAIFIMPWKYVRYVEDKTYTPSEVSKSYIFDNTPVISGCRPAQVQWISDTVKSEFTRYSTLGISLLVLYVAMLLALLIVYKSSIIGLPRLWFVLSNVVVFLIARGVQGLLAPVMACDPMPSVRIIYTSFFLPTLILLLIGIVLGILSIVRLLHE
jgi:hypothetical protein